MRRPFVVLAIAVVLLWSGSGASAGTRTTITFDLGGATITCPAHTYTFTVGSHSVFDLFQDQSSSGNTINVFTTDPSSDVHLIDEAGSRYTIRGVIVSETASNTSSGATETTYVAKLPIVADEGGGVADVDNLIVHASPNGYSFSYQFGTCEFD